MRIFSDKNKIMDNQMHKPPQNSKVANYIYSTTDYDLFNTIPHNRSLDLLHLSRLRQAIEEKNLLFAKPIEVDSNMNIIDGQHRLRVARELDTPIFYTIVPQLSEEDIQTLNSNQKPWSSQDYLRSYVIKGNEHYIKLQEYIDSFNIPLSSAMYLMRGVSASAHRDGKKENIVQLLRSGTWTVVRPDYAITVAGYVKEFSKFFSGAYSRSFITAIAVLAKNKEYSQLEMMEKLVMQPTRLTRAVNYTEYMRILESIYNYNRKGANIRFL